MSNMWQEMKKELFDFRIDRDNMNALKDSKNEEILNINRLVKNEVIDIADQVDVINVR
jgi:hypothetical protein